MKKIILLAISMLFLLKVQSQLDTASPMILENEEIQVTVDLFGGAFTDVHFKNQKLNPFSWSVKPEQMPPNNQGGAVFQGHFLCLGRWGGPTKGEINAGIPHNGIISNTMWSVAENKNDQYINMYNYAPRDGLAIFREIELSKKQAIYKVRETIENITSTMRINNIVQHATLGPPFLDEETLIHTNATYGFNQNMDLPNPHKHEFTWPIGYLDTIHTKVDMRETSNDHNYCMSLIYEDTIGWVTAASPSQNLLVGFVWDTREYPWINIWQYINDKGVPSAKGIEFGTTGIGEVYQKILKHDTRFHGRQSFEILDATKSVTKDYYAFLVKIPADFQTTEKIQYTGERITIIDASGNKYTFNLEDFDTN